MYPPVVFVEQSVLSNEIRISHQGISSLSHAKSHDLSPVLGSVVGLLFTICIFSQNGQSLCKSN